MKKTFALPGLLFSLSINLAPYLPDFPFGPARRSVKMPVGGPTGNRS